MITAVNRYLNFAGHRECAVRALKVQTRQCPDNILSIDEYRRMTDYARKIGQDKYYCIMRTLALNGIRVSELSGCTVEAGVPWTKAHLHSFRHLSAITYMQKYANLPEQNLYDHYCEGQAQENERTGFVINIPLILPEAESVHRGMDCNDMWHTFLRMFLQEKL